MQEVFFIRSLRSGFGRLMGSLSTLRADDMLAQAIRQMVDFHPFIRSKIEALYVGDSNQVGEDSRNIARQSALLAGLPETVLGLTFNSLCLSGIDALLAAVRAVQVGEIEAVLVAAVENMSRSPFAEHRLTAEKADTLIGWRFINPNFPYPTYSMVETSELMSKKYQISRQAQDDYAYLTRCRYENAKSKGYFNDEITAFKLPNGNFFDKDEQHRVMEKQILANFSPLLPNGEYNTLCNSARAADGVILMLICNQKTVDNFVLNPIAKFKMAATAAVNPNEMSFSGIAAFQKLQKKCPNLPKIDIIEQSESFAMQTLLHSQQLGWDINKINIAGGAISIGNPTSVGNLRLVGAILNHFQQQTDLKHGLISASAGLGIGAALILENLFK
jgi:acetyl-CoA acetyltransferase family protein